MSRVTLAFAMRSQELLEQLVSADSWSRLASVADIVSRTVLTEFDSDVSRQILSETDALITGWGSPMIDDTVLDSAPRLTLIAHAAGTVKTHVSPSTWMHGITVTTAAAANAIPVAEYTVASILLAGKNAHGTERLLRRAEGTFDVNAPLPMIGNYRSTVGIIGASRVGRLVLDYLRPFGFQLLLSSPGMTKKEAAALGAHLVPMGDLLAMSDIVSLHAPLLPSTIGMIGRHHIEMMKEGATFINTARGKLVDQSALYDHLERERINAVLDVTDPEPLPSGHPLYSLPNVVLTPHIAGSYANELFRLGDAAIAEVERLANDEPALFPVTVDELDHMA